MFKFLHRQQRTIDLDTAPADCAFEAELLQTVPDLPPQLRSRTLARCAEASGGRRRSRHRNELRWMIGALGLFGIQWLLIAALDAQSAALIAGDHPPQVYAFVNRQGAGVDWRSMMHSRSGTFAYLTLTDAGLIEEMGG